MNSVLAFSFVALLQAQTAAQCVVTGRVTDETGQPIPNLRVFAARADFVGGELRLVAGGFMASALRKGQGAVTDARGNYEIATLLPDVYYVNVLPEPTGAASPVGPRFGLAPAFYPAARDFSGATPIDLTRNCNAAGIDILVRRVPLAAVHGVVRGPDGSILTRGGVTARPHGGAASLRSVPIRPDGTFVFEDLAPGTYTLMGPPFPRAEPGGLQPIPAAEVSVDGIDVTGVVLAPQRPITVRGRLVLDHGGTELLPASRLRVVGSSVDQTVVPGVMGVRSPVAEDFSFTLEVPRGRLVLSVASAAGALPPGWRVDAVRMQGVDVSDVIDVRGDISGVEIRLTADAPEVFGSVYDATGALSQDYVVILFAQDPSRWSIPLSRYVVRGFPTAKGVFRTTATMPPGAYYAVALPPAHARRWQDPQFLGRISSFATAFSLDSEERIELKLTLACEHVNVC